MQAEKLIDLATRLVNGVGSDNALDVECELALFEPDEAAAAVRANAAGTKVIYTDHDGFDVTCWAPDWTAKRLATAQRLRICAELLPTPPISRGEG